MKSIARLTLPSARILHTAGLCLTLLALPQCSFFIETSSSEAPPSTPEKTLDTRIFPVLDNPELLVIQPGDSGRTITLPPAGMGDAIPAIEGNVALAYDIQYLENDLDWEGVKLGDGEAFDDNTLPQPSFAGSFIVGSDGDGWVSAHPVTAPDTPRWKVHSVVSEDTVEPVYVLGAGQYVYTASGSTVRALDAEDGDVVWSRALPLTVQGEPAISEDALYLTTSDNQLWALDRVQGSILWHYRGLKSQTERRGSAPPAIDGNRLVVAFASGEVVAMDRRNGRIQWRQEIGHARRTSAANTLNDIDAAPRIVGGKVYIISSAHLFVCLDLITGMRLWERELSGVQPPWVAGDYVFVLDMNNRVLAFDRKTGDGIWQTNLPGNAEEPVNWYGPVVADGVLLVSSDHGKLLVLRPEDGKVTRKLAIPETVRTAPLPAYNTLYLFGRDATLYTATLHKPFMEKVLDYAF